MGEKSSSGLENTRHPEVANTASKFGLRGVTHALREVLRHEPITAACLNLGDVGVIAYENGVMRLGEATPGHVRILPADLLAVLHCLINLSSTSTIKEINLSARTHGA